MKPDRIANIVLTILVLLLAILWLSKKGAPAAVQPEPQQIVRTNTVDRWHTNTVELWRTNTVELWRTNTVVKEVTKEVTKEVPAKISEAVQNAATLGYRYGHAPQLTTKSDALYQASPLAVDVAMNDSARNLLASEDTAAIKKNAEDTLRARGIAVAADSPYHLQVNVAALWTTGVPSVVLFQFRLELTESVVVARQADVVKCTGSVWAIARLTTPVTDNLGDEVKKAVQNQIDKFCDDYLRAKAREKEIQAQIPAVPADFLSQP